MVGASCMYLASSRPVIVAPTSVSPTGLCSPRSLHVKHGKKLVQVRASSTNEGQSPAPPSQDMNPFKVIWEILGTIWKRTLNSLGDFGFGARIIWEGGVGFFVLSGAVLLALSLVWLRGFYLRSRFRKYQAVFEFSQACGISMGTPVRIRGVAVGTMVQVVPSLKSIEAVAETKYSVAHRSNKFRAGFSKPRSPETNG